MKSAAACRDPYLLHRRLRVDHDLPGIREVEGHYPAGPIDFRVDIRRLDRPFDRGKRCLRLLIVVACLSASIVGCGMKGPLYIPGVPASAQWPYPTPTPAAQTPEQKKPADVPGTSDEKK
jgi:predicted small lipoprotein YifL